MGVRLQNTFADFCADPTPPVTFSGFAMIRLVNDAGGNMYNATTKTYLPPEMTVRADIDPNTGTWTSCELDCNNEIFPAGTYYEIQEIVNGHCQATHMVQLDCVTNTYPDPTPVADVSITAGAPGSTLLAAAVVANETVFAGVPGAGISISAAGVSGHAPVIAAVRSGDVNNALIFGSDMGLYVSNANAGTDTQVLPLGVIGELNPVTQGAGLRFPAPANATLTMDTPTLVLAADQDVIAELRSDDAGLIATATIPAGTREGTWDITNYLVPSATFVFEILTQGGTVAQRGEGLALPVYIRR